MKANRIIIALVMLMAGMSSCQDWFDVSPKADVKAEDMFEAESGFRDILTGVYGLMIHENLYGRQLTFGYTDVLAQYYNQITTQEHEYIKTVDFKYNEPVDKAVIEKIWLTQYKAIANLNTLLAYIDKKQEVFSSDAIYRIYKGEALALRAFLHFDLLRLYGPSPAVGKEHKAIPYMEEFTNIASRRLTVNQVLEKVAADLNKARELMREVDSYGPNYADLEETYAQDKRLKNRRFHLNYYAATALLARVQLYAGNTTEALAAAREIIGTAETLPVAPFELVTEVTSADRLFQNELLFGLEMKQMKVVISDYFGEAASKANLNNNTHMLAFSVSAQNNLFAPQNPADDDYRLKIWFKETSSNVANMSNKFEGVEMMPLIRISELYYIAAECLGGKEGLAYLNKIRAYRGLKALTDDSTLQNEIYKEYCKEFLNEGQMFYYYKRKYLSQLGVFKSKAIDPEAVYMLPLPVDEQDYGNKN